MNALLFVSVVLFVLCVTAFLAWLLIMISAKNQWQFTRIQKGNTVLIIKGDDLKHIIPNVDGHRMSEEKDNDGRRWLVKVNVKATPEEQREEMRQAFRKHLMPGTRALQKLLWDKWGVRFVSWVYPQNRVKRVHISMNRLRQESEVKPTTTLQERIETDEGDIDSIRFIFPRPMVVEGVELAGDNARINLLILMHWRLVIPSLPIFYYDGKFMPLLDADIAAGFIDFGATYKVTVNDKGLYDPEGTKKEQLTYRHWLGLSKDRGSDLHNHLLRLNASPSFYKALKDKKKDELVHHLDVLLGGRPKNLPKRMKEKVPLGLIAKYGLTLVDVDILAWEADETTKDLAEALQSRELQKRKAEGVREEAYGERDAIQAKAKAEASRYEMLVNSLIDKGVDPDVAAKVVQTQVEMENLRQWQGNTYVRGQAGVIVPAGTSQASATPPSSP